MICVNSWSLSVGVFASLALFSGVGVVFVSLLGPFGGYSLFLVAEAVIPSSFLCLMSKTFSFPLNYKLWMLFLGDMGLDGYSRLVKGSLLGGTGV